MRHIVHLIVVSSIATLVGCSGDLSPTGSLATSLDAPRADAPRAQGQPGATEPKLPVRFASVSASADGSMGSGASAGGALTLVQTSDAVAADGSAAATSTKARRSSRAAR